MDKSGVQSQEPVTLVGASAAKREDIDEALKYAPRLVAADGGADQVLAAGWAPEAVIGDLDSLGSEARDALKDRRIIEIAEQESTDFEKCLVRIDAPLVIAVGFTEGRLDHTLAVLSVLARGIGPPTIVIGQSDLVVAARHALSLDLAIGSRFSLFPMGEIAGRSEGLEWPIDALRFSPVGRIGTSNRVTGPVRVEFDRPGMLVILPREALAEVLRALSE